MGHWDSPSCTAQPSPEPRPSIGAVCGLAHGPGTGAPLCSPQEGTSALCQLGLWPVARSENHINFLVSFSELGAHYTWALGEGPPPVFIRCPLERVVTVPSLSGLQEVGGEGAVNSQDPWSPLTSWA